MGQYNGYLALPKGDEVSINKNMKRKLHYLTCINALCSQVVNATSIRGKLYSKFSFGEVYLQIYGRKFSFTATHERSH